jgi:hypothetical protein
MNPFEVTSASLVGSYYTFIAYRWVDTNGDGLAQKNEVLTNLGPQYSNAINPANPTSASSPNTIASDYHANRDNEIIVGIDHELMPNLGVGTAYTYRQTNDWPTWNPRIGLTSADYSVVATPSGNGRTATVYAPNAALVDATGGGRILENRPDYHSRYQGLEMTMTKRLSNKWMARIAFSINDWQGSSTVPPRCRIRRTDSTTVRSAAHCRGAGRRRSVTSRSGGSGKGDILQRRAGS